MTATPSARPTMELRRCFKYNAASGQTAETTEHDSWIGSK